MLVVVYIQKPLGVTDTKIFEVQQAVRIVLAHQLNEPTNRCRIRTRDE